MKMSEICDVVFQKVSSIQKVLDEESQYMFCQQCGETITIRGSRKRCWVCANFKVCFQPSISDNEEEEEEDEKERVMSLREVYEDAICLFQQQYRKMEKLDTNRTKGKISIEKSIQLLLEEIKNVKK